MIITVPNPVLSNPDNKIAKIDKNVIDLISLMKKTLTDTKKSKGSDKKLEGCLSIPNIWGYLQRPEKIRLRYMDIQGKIMDREISGFMATICQHEMDHLNGILLTQRVLEQNQKLYQIEK